MKKTAPFVFAAGILALIVGTMWFLYQKSRPAEAKVQTDKPFITDIIKKSIASGSIQPRREVEIKPKVAGILKNLRVKSGDRIKKGDLIGEVQIITDPVGLNEAELRLRSAVLREERTKIELDRIAALTGRGTLPQAEMDRARSEYDLAVEETVTARSRVQLLKSGALKQSKGAATQIESTVDGMVLLIPVKEGSSVINANSFNAGTTVAFVADMSDMIFKGTVDESEVGRLKAGMPVEIVIGALNDLKFPGVLEFVAPKSKVADLREPSNSNNSGTTEFEIEASFKASDDVLVRAGYSANANIVLERREKALAINESYLIFEKGKPHVEVIKGPETVERRPVKLGLSDGINVEVLDGVTQSDNLRRPQ